MVREKLVQIVMRAKFNALSLIADVATIAKKFGTHPPSNVGCRIEALA